MLRRRCGGVSLAMAINTPSLSQFQAIPCLNSCRNVTTRGQFNPIHAFTVQSTAPAKRATNEKEFEVMITNPGPLRVAYSPDYLDWLYRAYNSKIRYANERKKAEEVFQGMLLTGQPTAGDATAAAALPGAPPPGQTLRPRHSIRRLAGEARRAAAQEKLDALAQNQGLLDLFERQPQFPAIHIDKALRYHVVELFKEMVLDRAWEPTEVWDKALLYRAILNERKSSYPSNYKYILDTAEAVTLTPRSARNSVAFSGSNAQQQQQRAADVVRESESLVPNEDDYLYFLYLVRRYYLDNAVEGHVVLRCHRCPNASELLFSRPPPKDEQDVLRSVYGQGEAEAKVEKNTAEGDPAAPAMGAAQGRLVRPRPPSAYPPIEALWRCEENEALLRVLVFGELNLLVSENPFVRFPNAQAYLTRPTAATPASASSVGANMDDRNSDQQQLRDNRRGNLRSGGNDGGVSLSSIISEKRGHLLAPLARNVATMLDARANDVRRLQQRHEREDTAAFQSFLRAPQTEENPGLYSSYTDWSYFNPRAVRAEDRDALSRQAIAALKTYDQASKDIYRVGYEEAESSNARRVIEGRNNAPSYVPTLPHFVSLIKKDPYVSFLTYVALPTEYGASSSPHAPSQKRQLEKLVVQLGRALHRTALDFHKQPLRRVNRQKVQVAAALLDRFVVNCWRIHCAEQPSTEGVRDMAQRFSAFVPFEGRILDESGFPTDARVEDYERWMAPPSE